MEKVLILLSTFNGHDYLAQQLDSIFTQNDVIPYILVRDDGSSDDTLEILSNYQMKYPDRISIVKGDNVGWKKSFFTLLYLAYLNYHDFSLFAFSDQDDIWLPDKLKSAIGLLGDDNITPALYCSSLSFYKDGESRGIINKKIVTPNPYNALIRNYATGCTVVFNRQLLDIVAPVTPDIDVPHDYWVYLAAVLCGKAVIDGNSHILYRQHDNNQIGSESNLIDVWNRRIRSVADLFSNRRHELLAKEALRILRPYMKPEALDAASRLALYRSTFKTKISILFDRRYAYNKADSDFWKFFRIIFNRF